MQMISLDHSKVASAVKVKRKKIIFQALLEQVFVNAKGSVFHAET